MVLFFIIALAVSIVGMTGLLGFKRYELVSGNVLFASARPAVGTFFRETLWWVEKVLPALIKTYSRRAVHLCKVVLQRGIARSILWVEHTLERVLHTVREQTTTLREPGEASAFLREVAEHKRSLTRKSRKHGAPKEGQHVEPVTEADVVEIAVQKSEFEVE